MKMTVIEEIRKKDLMAENNHPAIITSLTTISYKELKNKIQATAAYLNSLGVKQNTKAAILSGNNPDCVIYILAIWSLNACVIPLNIQLSDAELTDILNFSDAEFLFLDNDVKRNIPLKIPREAFIQAAGKPKYFRGPGMNPDGISLIMYTSGVTGKPKGVMHTLNDLINSADNSQSLLSQTQKDRWLASLPFYHIGGLSILSRTFRFGSTLIIPDSLKHTDLRNALDNFNPTLSSMVSTQLNRLIETNWKPGKELRNILLGGGFVDEELIKEAVSAGCIISNVYGSTETSAFVTANNPEMVKLKPLSAGKALGENKIFIADEELNQVEPGTPGEILVEGNSLFHGYYKDGESTGQKLIDGKYRTGDIGFIDEEGDLFVQARRTDLIITGGENVNALEVENVLNKMSAIGDSCVFALPDKEWGQIVAAAVVLKNKISLIEIAEFMKGKIASYKIPKRFFPVDKIPKSSLEKIMREKVKEEIEILINL